MIKTWKQFKEAAEAAGVKDEDALIYIDWAYTHHGAKVLVVARWPEGVVLT